MSHSDRETTKKIYFIHLLSVVRIWFLFFHLPVEAAVVPRGSTAVAKDDSLTGWPLSRDPGEGQGGAEGKPGDFTPGHPGGPGHDHHPAGHRFPQDRRRVYPPVPSGEEVQSLRGVQAAGSVL